MVGIPEKAVVDHLAHLACSLPAHGEQLAAKAAEAKAGATTGYAEQIEALKVKQAAAKEKIEQLQQAGESAWEDLRSGAELAWTAMSEAIDSARSRFK